MIVFNCGKGNRKFEVELFYRSDQTLAATFVNVRPPYLIRDIAGKTWRRKPKWSTICDPGRITFSARYERV